MIHIAVIEDLDSLYPTLAEWWTGHGWPAVPQAILPLLGIVANDGESPVAAAWLYMDNSVGVSMLEWIVTDPEAPARKSAVALSRIVGFAKEEAAHLGYSVMLTTCRQPSLAKLLTRSGFTETDANMIHLVTTLTTPEPISV